MPEYLAPGVYVEETSFRAKSIEGVSTSTTGFVGQTRKGPYFIPGVVEETPELLTSFADFERIYGGLEDLSTGPNYLAHAVRAYFDNGGSRLFVSRVFQPGEDGDPRSLDSRSTATQRALFGLATSPDLVPGTNGNRARFTARFPGRAGNGYVALRQIAAPVTRRTLDAAPMGSLLRVGGRQPQTPARLEGGRAPFAMPGGGQLQLTVGASNVAVTVRGDPTEVVGETPLADPITVPAGDATLRLVIDGISQEIALPTAETPLEELVETINQEIRGGSASLTDDDDDGPADRLVIRSDRRGTAASVIVRPNATLGFPAQATAEGTADPDNTVGDLQNVTADDLNALFQGQGIGVRASVDPATGNLTLTSTASGADARIAVRAESGSQHARLGFMAGQSAAGSSGTPVSYYVKTATGWEDGSQQPLDFSGWQPNGAPSSGADLLTLGVLVVDADDHQMSYEGLGFHPSHPLWVGNVLAAQPARRSDALENLFAAEFGREVNAFALREALFPGNGERSLVVLTGGNEGVAPTSEAYRRALQAFEKIEDISIVAAPDAAADRNLSRAVQLELITHVERRRAYRIAVLDVPRDMTPTEAMEVRGAMDSHRAALYYPWVMIANPLARAGDASIPEEIAVPPSGFVTGIYARNDVERGVFKAPANEVVRGALRFERDVNFAQQELLNPAGVNCLRFFPGRGYRVWGARTASSDPEWKYVNVRRYFNYLERSIDQGTQWVVFEPNGERLWQNVQETISSFLYNEWVSGALLGQSQKEAFFVKCDRSTMTQQDLDTGRLICLIGVAVVKPAEFVIFRIGQKTADSRS